MTTTVGPPQTSINRWWRVVGGLSMNLALGTLYAWSVFIAPLEKQFGWKRTQSSMTFTIAVVAFALAFIVAGRLQDKFGPFWVSLTGGLLVSLGFFMSAGVQSLSALYWWFGVVAGIGLGFGYTTPIAVMSKWFPDHRGLAVGLAVAGFGGGSAIFGPLCKSYLIPHYGLPATFRILSGIFLVMTTIGSFLLQNPPAGYSPEGWNPDPASPQAGTKASEFTPAEVLRSPVFYLMWIAYALGTSAGLMVISQLDPFAKGEGISPWAASTALLVGAAGSASGRTLSGWMSDALGRLNVLRLMIGLSVIAMPLLYASVANVGTFFLMVFTVYWCFGTQLSVNASTAADFWGTKNVGANYAMLYTAYGVAGVIGPRIGATLFDAQGHYRTAFTAAAGLAAVALVFELLARRPAVRPGEES